VPRNGRTEVWGRIFAGGSGFGPDLHHQINFSLESDWAGLL
jgi:hypothetical protein